MLHWSIPLIMAPAGLALLTMSGAIRHVLVIAARVVYRVINWLGAWASVALDMVLAPDDRSGRPGVLRQVLWVATNFAAAAAIYALRSSQRADAALISAWVLVILHVTLLTASILVIAEENRIMHHGEPKQGALFGHQAAVRDLGVIILESILALVSAAVLLDMLAGAMPGALLTRTPATPFSFSTHILCLLAALPGTSTLVALTEFADQVAFGGRYGGIVQSAIYLLGSGLLYGAVAAWIYQRSAIGMILSRLDEADGDEAHFLQLVLSRAPQHVKADLLALALNPSKQLAQPRAINIMRHLKVWTFPQTFLHHLDRFERSVQTLGLNQIRAFLADEGEAFEDELILTSARKAFERYIEIAPSIKDKREDGVLSRLGAVITSNLAILQSRQLYFKTSREQYGVMLDIAKSHKSDEVRLTMVDVILARSPKGFLKNYLVNMHERSHDDVDTVIIQKLATYVRSRPEALSAEEREVVLRRLNSNIRHAGLDAKVSSALRKLQEVLQAQCARQSGTDLAA